MPAKLACPRCGGENSSDSGAYTCVYCGMKYGGTVVPTRSAASEADTRVNARRAHAEPPRPKPAARTSWRGIGAMVLIAVAVQGVYFGRQLRPKRVPTAEAPVEAVAVDASGAATITEPSAAATAAEPGVEPAKPTVEYTYHSQLPTKTHTFLYGMVKNTSSGEVHSTKVTLRGMDASGAVVVEDHAYAAIDALPAGGESPVMVIIDQLLDSSTNLTFQAEAEPGPPILTPATGLAVTGAAQKAPYYGWNFTGTVSNGGEAPARFVKVLILGFDAKDRLVGFHDTYATGEDAIAAGAVKAFEGSQSLWSTEPARFAFQVHGVRVD